MHDDKLDNLKWYFPALSISHFLPVVRRNREDILDRHRFIRLLIFFRQITAAAGATAQQPPATSTNTSPFLTVLEAEKQTASYVVGAENAGQKTRNQLRTPGRVYNWDG